MEIPLLKREIEDYLESVLPAARKTPRTLHQAMRYSVFSGGKRLRPLLVLVVGELLGVPRKRLLPAACSLELIHNFSLIHDDLPAMDNDDFRRGKPTCHKKFGEAVAILAGDALLTLAFEILAKHSPPELVIEAASAIGSRGMAGGQTLDILYQNRKTSGRLKRRLDQLKTGKLFELCFQMPCYYKKIPPAARSRVARLGRDFGLAFQIRDDLEDRQGNKKTLQKKLKLLCRKMEGNLASFGTKGASLGKVFSLLYPKLSGD